MTIFERISAEHKEDETYNRLQGYYDRAKARAAKGAIHTGFAGLDDILSGGLYSGLYIIGGGTSIGKTSFILQLADTIAASGKDVMFYSLEMSADELIARSLSRITYQHKGLTGALSMIECYLWKSKDRSEDEVTTTLSAAYDEYINTIGKHLYITEGNSHTSIQDIKDNVQCHQIAAEISLQPMDKSPVIFIDYLQLIAPESYYYTYTDQDGIEHERKTTPNQTDKQRIDKIIQDLKTLSRDLDTPVICVSSYNRGAYNKGANLDNFKESGNIEYSSDVCMCLQLQGATNSENNADKESSKELMKQEQEKLNNGQFGNIELCILKNRRGKKDVKQPLLLNNRYNIYMDESQLKALQRSKRK